MIERKSLFKTLITVFMIAHNVFWFEALIALSKIVFVEKEI